MARWLIDGNNVMGSRPDGWWRDRAKAKARLAGQVRGWEARVDHTVVVVFDGHDDKRVRAAAGAGVEVRFADTGRRDGADDVIVALAVGGDTVVTADRELIRRLGSSIDVVGPRSFLVRLR